MDDSRPYSLEEGKELVWTARHIIETITVNPNFEKRIGKERLAHHKGRHGIFVTIEHYPTKSLRGCIGFTKPIAPVGDLLVEAAIAAATEDPRFVPISHVELDSITIEASILTQPVQLKAKSRAALPKEIKIGRDGLIATYGYKSGLLLPIVAIEEHWAATTFLDNVCIKAGLAGDAWKTQNVSLSKFSTQVFREREPRGEIEEVVLK